MTVNVLAVSLLMLNGNFPLITVVELDSMKMCESSIKEDHRLDFFDEKDFTESYCILVGDLVIKKLPGEFYYYVLEADRGGGFHHPVLGINLQTKKFDKFVGLSDCFKLYEVCGYSFQEFSYKPLL